MFELEAIKDHPILLPVVTPIIMEVFISKMRKLEDVRKMILIEDASYQLAALTQHKIYILAKGQALEALAADRKENILVEAKDHIRLFHEWFFNLDPDDKAIQASLSKALYLIDGSGKQQFQNLRENGYYASLIAGNISQRIQIDSTELNITFYPYYFRLHAHETILRATSILHRLLTTEGHLRNVNRSDNNITR